MTTVRDRLISNTSGWSAARDPAADTRSVGIRTISSACTSVAPGASSRMRISAKPTLLLKWVVDGVARVGVDDRDLEAVEGALRERDRLPVGGA